MSSIASGSKPGYPLVVLALVISTIQVRCAGSEQYVCPDPIGPIVRDDCDAYKVKYDSMRVNLAAGFSRFKVETSFADDAARDPSELIQVMAARMTALCRDFNACHLTPREYIRRRDELDRTSTAIVALGDQLATPGLSHEQRRKVLDRLLAMLASPASTSEHQAQARHVLADPVKKKKPKPPKRYLSSSDMWFGSVILPPQAPAVADGFPRLVAGWRRLNITSSCKLPGGGRCYRPYPSITLWGPHEADDILVLTFDGGVSTSCPVRKSGNGVVSVRCQVLKKLGLTTPAFKIYVEYIRAEDDRRVRLGEIKGDVVMADIKDYRTTVKNFGVNHDKEMSQGWLFFLPDKRQLPADFEKPYIYATMRYRKAAGGLMFPKGTLRCWVDGAPVTPALKTTIGSGQTGWFQDKDRYVQVSAHSSVSSKDPIVVWKHYLFELPYYVRRNSEPLPEGAEPWPPKQGHWTCKIKVEGEYLRKLEFDVDEEGKPTPLEGQKGEPGDLVFPWWKIKAKILPNNIEGRWSKKAKRGPSV